MSAPCRQSDEPPIDGDRVLRETFVRGFEFHAELPSTNTHALQTASGIINLPHLIVARTQTRGRGRGANQWWSEGDALTFSLVFAPGPPDDQPKHLSLLPFAAGTAVAEAVEAALADPPGVEGRWPKEHQVSLKWPNDVYLNDRKLSGILIETIPTLDGLVVVGVGINVNDTFRHAPAAVQERATSLLLETQQRHSPEDLLVEFLRRFDHWESIRLRCPQQLVACCRARCWLTGKEVLMQGPQGEIRGRCEGIGDDGSLVLSTADGRRRVMAGTVCVAE